jgi:hypothetical protein
MLEGPATRRSEGGKAAVIGPATAIDRGNFSSNRSQLIGDFLMNERRQRAQGGKQLA